MEDCPEKGHITKMSAETYNRIRRILLSVSNDPKRGFSAAYDMMESTYRRQLDPQGYVGLMAELRFYETHGREYCLTIGGDMGEHADFAGVYGAEPTRFDVTTNLAFKRFEDYEPFMGKGLAYKIALLDRQNFEIVDVLNLAFPKCKSCGCHLFPAIVLLGQNYNRHGESRWSNDQVLLDVCGGCEEIIERERFSHYGLFSVDENFDNGYGLDDEVSAFERNRDYAVSAYKSFRRKCSDYLMAVGSHRYLMTEPDGSGHWAIYFDFVNNAVASSMPRYVECSHEI